MLAFQYLHAAMGFAVSTMAVASLLKRDHPVTRPLAAPVTDRPAPTFLFRDRDLVDATPQALRLLRQGPQLASDLDTVIGVLSRHFSQLGQAIAGLADQGHMLLRADGADGLDLAIEREKDQLRLGLVLADGAAPKLDLTEIERAAMEDEIAALRELTRHAPAPIWREDAEGRLVWANQAYLQMIDRLGPNPATAEGVWPETPLFPDLARDALTEGQAVTARQSVRLHEGKGEHWFDVTRRRSGDSVIHYALDATAAVRAERMKEAFYHTLSRSFANLATGLAVFDRDRRLKIFNPALSEMTGLSGTFLATMPTLEMLLDQLRENRKLPEPRDYSTYRDQFAAMIGKAEQGKYQARWDLIDGITLNVTGRSHPDGGLEFTFEDITEEIAQSRRLRSESETGQSVLDALPDAISVFSNANTMMQSNLAYADLWGIADDSLIAPVDLRGALRVWKDRCAPSPLWAAIEEFVLRTHDRHAFRQTVNLIDGRQARCDISPLAGGATMIRFTIRQADSAHAPTLVGAEPIFRAAKR